MKSFSTLYPGSKILIINLLLISSMSCFGQAWDIIYEPGPDMGRDVILTNDYCYVATSINSPWVSGKSIKINQRGAIIWETPYGGMAIQQTFDNGYVLAGCMAYQDAMITKLNENGTLQWSKQYGGLQQDEFFAIIESADSGLVAGGITYSHGDSTVYIVKTDEAGNLIWYRNYKWYDNGGVNDLLEYNNDFYFVGSSYDSSYTQFLFVTKLNSSGNQEWRKVFRGWFINPSVEISADSSLIISAGHNLLKISLDGDSLWSKSLEPSLIIHSLDIAPDNGYILSGSKVFANTNFTNALIKTDSLGNTEWIKIYRGVYNDYWGTFESVKCAYGNGYTACGYSLFENSTTKWRIIKTDASGDCIVSMDPGQKIEATSFYPNPTSGKIKSDSEYFDLLELYSAAGTKVFYCYDCSEMDLFSLPYGVYILKIYTQNSISYQKIIKQ